MAVGTGCRGNLATRASAIANYYRRAAADNFTAVGAKVTDQGGRFAIDEDSGGTTYYFIRWADANSHITDPGSWHVADGDIGRALLNEPAYMRYRAGLDFRTDMHIANSGGGVSHGLHSLLN